MNTKNLSGIYAITDPHLLQDQLVVKAEQAIRAGIQVLQYRNKSAPYSQQLDEAATLAELCKTNQVTFFVNDNLLLAVEANADGIHLGQNDTPLKEAREKMGEKKLIGITCHDSIDLALKAQANGADYVAFGRFFKSLTKPGAPAADLQILKQAKQSLNIPVVAIGGITQENAPKLLRQGVDMLAVIHGIFGQVNTGDAVKEFTRIFAKYHTN